MEKIRGIIIRIVKYSDKKQIVDMFTETRGRMSFVLPMKAKLSPLSILEFDIEIHPNKNLQSITSLSAIAGQTMMHNLRLDPVKSIISMFVVEFLSNALREEGPNTPLYKYIEDSPLWLDTVEDHFANFHIVFLEHLTRFLGVMPNLDGYSPSAFFDLMDGSYKPRQPYHPYFLAPDEARTLPYLFHMDYSNLHHYPLSRHQRQRCLEVLNDYFMIHIPGFPRLKSLDVLRSLFE